MTSASEATMSSTTISEVSTQRWLVRRAGGGGFWGAWLPAIGLALLAWWALIPFARSDIESTVRQGVQSALDANAMGWVNTAVSGQQVVLSGTPPDAAAGDRALALARAATCPTWTGPRTCAVEVIGAFGAVSAPALPAAPPVAAAPAPAAAPVPAPAAPAAATPDAACEQALAKVVEAEHIEFASGSAAISARSASVLDRLAKAARDCPGRVVIEGHTDNVGAAAANQALSQARADAVRRALLQRGLAADRLEARGFGPTKPVGPNDTPEGRAANRRIEFRAATAP